MKTNESSEQAVKRMATIFFVKTYLSFDLISDQELEVLNRESVQKLIE